MAFSLRKMLSNITYFSKPGDEENLEISVPNEYSPESQRQNCFQPFLASENIEFDCVEADSTSKCATSLNLPNSVKNYVAQKGSLSDTDLLNINIDATINQDRKKCKKLKLDTKKACLSVDNSIDYSEDSSTNAENTPKHKLLECKSVDLFKGFNFNQSFDISDAGSIASSCEEEVDIESLSDHSDTDISAEVDDDKVDIKMCRKVETRIELLPSVTPESFADVEVDKNEEERITLLLNYQMKLEKIECILKKLLTEFQFHIEVSKIFNCKSIVTALPGTDVTNIPKSLGNVTYIDNIQRGISPAGWNIVMEKEDSMTKLKLKNQLHTMQRAIDEFITTYLQEKPKSNKKQRSINFDQNKGKRLHKQNHVSYKKKIKHFDFPDLRDAMISLFSKDSNEEYEDSHTQCTCHCHSPPDSATKPDEEITNQSITSSIGNFSLDSTTLSAYSESLDQIVSYNSFNDSSLYNTLLQKAAIERITFYIQVHSIQLKAQTDETDSKNIIAFYCPICKTTDYEENGLMKHILGSYHCEKIHFIYKTAYVKKCISGGLEIQPSTVLNPMTMYRDDNKIVCFGDAVYACSLCFENRIVGESILIAHCANEEHVNRREMLYDILD